MKLCAFLLGLHAICQKLIHQKSGPIYWTPSVHFFVPVIIAVGTSSLQHFLKNLQSNTYVANQTLSLLMFATSNPLFPLKV